VSGDAGGHTGVTSARLAGASTTRIWPEDRKRFPLCEYQAVHLVCQSARRRLAPTRIDREQRRAQVERMSRCQAIAIASAPRGSPPHLNRHPPRLVTRQRRPIRPRPRRTPPPSPFHNGSSRSCATIRRSCAVAPERGWVCEALARHQRGVWRAPYSSLACHSTRRSIHPTCPHGAIGEV
jgi:hypothetical protein